jgi:hypothetical protein
MPPFDRRDYLSPELEHIPTNVEMMEALHKYNESRMACMRGECGGHLRRPLEVHTSAWLDGKSVEVDVRTVLVCKDSPLLGGECLWERNANRFYEAFVAWLDSGAPLFAKEIGI